MKRVIAVVLFCIFPFAALGFGNDDVIKLIKAGFSDEVVLQAIAAEKSPEFDTSADGLVALKNSGASETVIKVVLVRHAEKKVTESAAVSAAPQTKMSDCKPEAAPRNTLPTDMRVKASGEVIFLPLQMAREEMRVNALASILTFGLAKARGGSLLVLDGKRAGVRITGMKPEIPRILVAVGLPPPESVLFLVQLTVENGSRHVQTASGELNIAGSSERSVDFGGALVPTTFEKESEICMTQQGPQVPFRMVSKVELKRGGEYAFVAPQFKRMWAFGVD